MRIEDYMNIIWKMCQRTARNIVFVLMVKLMRHIVKSLAGVSSRHDSKTDRLEQTDLLLTVVWTLIR